MKTTWILAGLTVAMTFPSSGQSEASSGSPPAAPRPAPGEFQVVERGPSHRVHERTTYEPNLLGQPTARKHRVVELATGMHYQEGGLWKESREIIETFPGGALARQGQHKVIFANNLATAGAIDTELANGERLSGHPLMLAYYDTASGKMVPLAEVKDCQGKVSGNQVWYEDACEGLKCTIRYTYSRAGLEQDVILLEQPPAPEAFGLASATTRLQMMTEFVTTLPVRKEPRALEVKGVGTLADESVRVGSARFGRSQAFTLGEQKGRWQGVPAARRWIELEGRQFLIEEVPVPAVQAEWRKLPKGQGASVNPGTNGIGRLASTKQILPAPREKQPDTRRMELAAVTPRPSGWVLDWQRLGDVEVDVTNLTFQADTTYLITGMLSLYGTTTIEGGTVIKFSSTNVPLLYVLDTLKCETSPYRPAVLTSEDDDTVGETIDCSTGSPTIQESYYLALETAPRVQGLRFAYAYVGLWNLSSAVEVWDCQFLHCTTAMWAGAPIKLRNLLLAHCNLGVDYGWMIFGEHLTVDDCALFAAVYGGYITNSLFTGVSTLGNVTLDHCVQAASGTGLYQSVGGGAYYLSLDSTNRNAGNPNINSELAAALRTKTTYPPVVYSNATLTVDTTFGPQAQRDTDVPDLGYVCFPEARGSDWMSYRGGLNASLGD